MNLKDLQKSSFEVAESKGFHKAQEATDPVILALYLRTLLTIGELSEAAEELRSGRLPTEIYYEEDGKPQGFPIELADALIRLCDLAESCGVDLTEAVEAKEAYNRTRAYLHGKTA